MVWLQASSCRRYQKWTSDGSWSDTSPREWRGYGSYTDGTSGCPNQSQILCVGCGLRLVKKLWRNPKCQGSSAHSYESSQREGAPFQNDIERNTMLFHGFCHDLLGSRRKSIEIPLAPCNQQSWLSTWHGSVFFLQLWDGRQDRHERRSPPILQSPSKHETLERTLQRKNKR
jgi:hypothetical protein